MKPKLLLAMVSMGLAVTGTASANELETLRTRCIEQEQQIRHLQEENLKLKSAKAESLMAPAMRTAAAAPAATEANAAAASSYTVRAGDSLERIARKSHCSPAQLAKANGLKTSSIIRPGQKLKLPGTSTAPSSTPADASPRTAATSPTPTPGATHKIQAGETYASISRKHRIPIESLVSANPDVKPTALRPGQVIRLSASETPAAAPARPPVAQSQPAVAAAPQARVSQVAMTPLQSSIPIAATRSTASATPSSKPAPLASSSPANPPTASSKKPETAKSSPSQETTPPPSNPEKKIHSVTIEGEMTYGEFAATHGTDTSRLNDLNGLDLTNATVLAKGSELYVPAQP